MRLGTTRYFERGEAFRLSAEDVGMRYRYEQVNTHAFVLATSGHFLITHAKVDHWGDPIEQKEYKQALARHNPSDSEPLPLPHTADPANPFFGIVVVLYARPGTGQDETLPMRLGFGIPARDLRGWHLLKTLDQIFAAYADLHHRPFDRARPRLRPQQDQADEADRTAARSRLHQG